MIRGFGLLCKVNLQRFSTVALYQYMAMVGVSDSPCPRCGTLRLDWTPPLWLGARAREKGQLITNIDPANVNKWRQKGQNRDRNLLYE